MRIPCAVAPLSQERLINRPQANGSMSFLKTGWGGSHTFRIGGEYMDDRLVAPTDGYGNPCNCVSTLNNGAPAQVQILLGPNVSKNDLTTAAGFVDDTWRLNRRVTLSLGMRLDRYQPSLPEQQGPAGQTFPAIDPVLTFNNWGPRAGHERRSHGRRQDCAETPLRTVLGLPGDQLHVGLQPESVRLVADLRSGPTTRTRTADGIRVRKDD